MWWYILASSCSFSLSTRIGNANCIKKDQSKTESNNWYQHVINGRKKRIRGGMCHAIHQYAIAIDKCIKVMTKIKNRCIFPTGM